MGKGNIFISYRRDDAAGYARAIYNHLAQFFSEDRIFMDVDTIEPGLEFEEAIRLAVDQCDILLAIIGKHWLGRQEENHLRINDAKDFVRLEVSTALSRDIRVIPILLDGATMPDEDILPESLIPLVRRHAFEVNSNRFNYDLDRLIKILFKALGEKRKLNKPVDKRYFWIAGGTLFGSLVGILVSASNFHRGDIIESVVIILSCAWYGLFGVMLGYRKFALFSSIGAYIANIFRTHSDHALANIPSENHEPNESPSSIIEDNLYIADALSNGDITFNVDLNHNHEIDIHDDNVS